MAKQRLQKILNEAGIDSRRNCEELILEGVVRVNGKVIDELPAFADMEEDEITVDGRKLKIPSKVYYLLNKPKGVLCTSDDPQGRAKATDLVPPYPIVHCAGRLDADTTGIIILTNDNILTNKITHPKYKLSKTYLARVKGKPDPEAIDKLKKGVWLSDGKTGRSSVKILKRGNRESLLELTISQGFNRQVRRTLAKIGFPVISLKRSKIGKLDDRGLSVGKFRALRKQEISYLKQTTTPKDSPR